MGAEDDDQRNHIDKNENGHVVADDIYTLLVPRDATADEARFESVVGPSNEWHGWPEYAQEKTDLDACYRVLVCDLLDTHWIVDGVESTRVKRKTILLVGINH